MPDQMTFQTEMQIIQAKQRGTTRVQVLSFSRLALRILQETGGISKYHIQRSGIHMLLRKIVEKEKSNFTILARRQIRMVLLNNLSNLLVNLNDILFPTTCSWKSITL
ncbi:MAG: hypothetical protein LRY73_03730 [Bacillus sp. (in: Bacteria)]|nr:hypothetical protein [Bacillus sp. (in: firmicutes)]